jgi:hypothetical protein
LAEGGGVEPPLPDPESGVLPLDDPSIYTLSTIIFYTIFHIGQIIIQKIRWKVFRNYIFTIFLSNS